MAAYDHVIKQNDLLEEIEDVLKVDGTVQDLTSWTSPKLHIREVRTGTVTTFTAAVSDAAAGKIKYTWTGTDTATSGLYHYEWEVTSPAGSVATWPNEGYGTLYISDDIA